jgi:hypothetical protein
MEQVDKQQSRECDRGSRGVRWQVERKIRRDRPRQEENRGKSESE